MSDNTAAPSTLANFDPAQVAALSPETRTSFAASLKAHGHDSAAVDAIFAVPTFVAPAAAPVLPAASGTPTIARTDAHGVTVDQAVSGAAALLKHRPDLAAEVAAVMKRDYGVDAAPIDERSESEKTFDRVFGAGKPEEFRIAWHSHTPEGFDDVSDLGRLDGDMRGALAAMKLPPALGASIAEQVIDDSASYARLDENSAKLYDLAQTSELKRMLPDGDVAGAVTKAAAVIRFAKDQNADFINEMQEHGAFRSARAVLQLSQHFDRLVYRAGLTAKRMGANG